MSDIKEEEQLSKTILRTYRPKLALPIWTTLICTGPLLNLLIDTSILRDAKKSIIVILITLVGIAWTSFLWFRYIKDKKAFIELKNEIPKVIHYLFLKDEASLEKMSELEEIINASSMTEALKNIRRIMDKDN